MFALLIPLLASLPGMIGKYFSEVNTIKQAELETRRQIELAKQQMAAEIAKAELQKANIIIGATGPMFKYFTFVMWFGPFMVGIFMPELSNEVFKNLAGMPEWYVTSCVAVMFTVWGINVGAPVVANIFSGLGGFFQSRREYKLEKAKIDRKAFFDGLKKIFPKGMNQAQVEIFDNALDEGEK